MHQTMLHAKSLWLLEGASASPPEPLLSVDGRLPCQFNRRCHMNSNRLGEIASAHQKYGVFRCQAEGSVHAPDSSVRFTAISLRMRLIAVHDARRIQCREQITANGTHVHPIVHREAVTQIC